MNLIKLSLKENPLLLISTSTTRNKYRRKSIEVEELNLDKLSRTELMEYKSYCEEQVHLFGVDFSFFLAILAIIFAFIIFTVTYSHDNALMINEYNVTLNDIQDRTVLVKELDKQIIEIEDLLTESNYQDELKSCINFRVYLERNKNRIKIDSGEYRHMLSVFDDTIGKVSTTDQNLLNLIFYAKQKIYGIGNVDSTVLMITDNLNLIIEGTDYVKRNLTLLIFFMIASFIIHAVKVYSKANTLLAKKQVNLIDKYLKVRNEETENVYIVRVAEI
ncbi:MAG: hypothetical protein JEZ08_22580 [Clostridiales bacterium]|nr:hypothetical protein [Clostridiales bacterium]